MGFGSPSATERFGARRALLTIAVTVTVVFGCGGGPRAQSASTRPPLAGSNTTARTAVTITVPVIVEAPTPTIRETFRRSVALVRVTRCDGGGSGSAFFTSPTTVITNYHVVEGATSVELTNVDGAVLDALHVERHATADLARITVRPSSAEVVSIETVEPIPGDDVHVVGFPRGRAVTSTEGRFVEYDADSIERAMALSAVVEPGNSGGPVFNDDGRVIGIATAVYLSTGVAVAIPVSELAPDRSHWTTEPAADC